METLIKIRNLNVTYEVGGGSYRAIRDLSLDIHKGEVLGIIGESGCGKSTLGKALLRLLPENGNMTADELRFGDIDLLRTSDRELRKLRWQEMALISQSAMNALNPVFRVGDQIVEAIRLHRSTGRKEALKIVGDLFETVGIPKNWRMSYPHELSGGMRQRVCIAMALALQPAWIIADEPTTALDVVTQKRILQLLRKLQREIEMTVILISHDIGVIAEMSDRVAVMYGGMLVEVGPGEKVIGQAAHPYTIGLEKSFPDLAAEGELIYIPGYPPNLRHLPSGCHFADRCPFVETVCIEQVPELVSLSEGGEHQAACHFSLEKSGWFREQGRHMAIWERRESAHEHTGAS